MSWPRAFFLVLLSKALGRVRFVEDWVARKIDREYE